MPKPQIISNSLKNSCKGDWDRNRYQNNQDNNFVVSCNAMGASAEYNNNIPRSAFCIKSFV